MNILMVSHVFQPSTGGLESVSMMLAEGFAEKGHEVVLVTQTTNPGEAEDLPFKVVRKPKVMELLQLVRWSDVYFHNNISLNVAWPLLLVRKPWVVAHHTWIPRGGGLRGLKGRVKQAVLTQARCIAISNAIAAHLNTPSIVIPNAYDDKRFRCLDDVRRSKDLVFIGRLVSDKGVDILLYALHKMKVGSFLVPKLTVIGDGPEEGNLRRLVQELDLVSNVKFAGRMGGEKLVRELNTHRILVVPSRWNEPFGIVALEGIACGCVVVASEGGGLADAVGPCGQTFPNGDVGALADCLMELLENPGCVDELRKQADQHLAQHSIEQFVSSYLEVLEKSVKDSKE
jgi:glycosyltransferase involved in cell wall biosynthesis